MGGCSSTLITGFAQEVVSEFLGKGALGKLLSVVTATRECPSPSQCNDMKDYMKCKFFEGHKEAYDLILILLIVLTIACAGLSYILWKKTKKVAIQFVNSSRMTNVQMVTNSNGDGNDVSSARNANSSDHLMVDAWI